VVLEGNYWVGREGAVDQVNFLSFYNPWSSYVGRWSIEKWHPNLVTLHIFEQPHERCPSETLKSIS